MVRNIFGRDIRYYVMPLWGLWFYRLGDGMLRGSVGSSAEVEEMAIQEAARQCADEFRRAECD